MKLTAQQMQQLENCSSAEEIMTLAKNANITITMEQAKKAFDLLNSENVSDDWMEQVVGGQTEVLNCTEDECDKHSYWN